ncbi:MAG TPA: hypothetical protein VFI53_12390 [Myxococcaceae bacterium]|nr:hypothetical protein [Myxococcaceae bacterium]
MASSGRRRKCQVPACGRPVHSRGYCASHYRQLLRGRTPTRPIRPRGNGEKPVLAVRLPATLIVAMDRKLRRAGLSRAELLEKLVNRWVLKRA